MTNLFLLALFALFYRKLTHATRFVWSVIFILCIGSLGYSLFRTYHNPAANSGIFLEYVGNNSPNFIERIISNIPEIDQIKVITTLAPFYHGMFLQEEAKRMESVSLPIYREMQKNKNWSALPSSLGDTYLSTLHLHVPQNQYSAYIPHHPAGQKLPVILFLHGFGGNFTSYLYQLSFLADTYHVAIIAPSYKNGIWDEDSVNFIDSVTQDAEQKFDIDHNNYYLMGISNGGLILPDVYKNNPSRYQGLIFFSTYLDKNVLLQPDMVTSLKDKKILVVQGSKDERIDPMNTKAVVTALRDKNLNISLEEFPSDHFLFFERDGKISNLIGQTFFINK